MGDRFLQIRIEKRSRRAGRNGTHQKSAVEGCSHQKKKENLSASGLIGFKGRRPWGADVIHLVAPRHERGSVVIVRKHDGPAGLVEKRREIGGTCLVS